MKTVGALITDVSAMVNDQRPGHAFTRWGRGFILGALNGALSEIGAYRQEAFAKTQSLTLIPGRLQNVPDGVKTVRQVLQNSDGTPIHEADVDLIRTVAGVCLNIPITFDSKGNPEYLVRNFALDKNDPKHFYVSPPVPMGLSVSVVANVFQEAPQYTLADWNVNIEIDGKFDNNVIDFMLGRIAQNDINSATARADAVMYFSRFYSVMGVKYKMESSNNSGYYLGKTGTGDPAARTP